MDPLDGPGLAPLAGALAGLGTPPAPDADAEPEGFLVRADDGARIHFLDWGGPAERADGGPTAVLLVHGLANTGWSWAPVARRLCRVARVVATDLRGHGLSDAPTDGYDPDTLAGDAIAAAEGAGLLPIDEPAGVLGSPGAPPAQFVIAGHGFGAAVAAWTANALGDRCAGLVLVDGGWEDVGATSESSPAEWLAAIEEPPEVLASMGAWLADRAAFDPATWDADQERAARAQVVETAAGRVKVAVHPHALAGSVEALWRYDPVAVLPGIEARVVALAARDDEAGGRLRALRGVAAAHAAAGRSPILAAARPELGHNLMRYAPDLVVAAILAAAGRARPAGPARPEPGETAAGAGRGGLDAAR